MYECWHCHGVIEVMIMMCQWLCVQVLNDHGGRIMMCFYSINYAYWYWNDHGVRMMMMSHWLCVQVLEWSWYDDDDVIGSVCSGAGAVMV